MTAVAPQGAFGPARLGRGWGVHLQLLAIVAAAILLLFFRDARDMAGIWLASSTFNHCALIPLIIAWLVWQRMPGLRRIAPAAWAPGLLIVAAGAGGWLLGEAGGVALARHAGLVLMLQGSVVACLGQAVGRALLFPILYALFMVPTGEEIVPLMQTVTAEMCMALLRLAGVPAHLEGVFISIPNGYFEVAEACAGVKFLIAMVALGALVANVCFTDWRRRALFMLASVVVPILANGLRAFATVYVASRTSAEAASGFDHVVYGGVFFAVVIATTIGIGWRFFDRHPGDPWFDPDVLQPVRPARSPIGGVAVAALLVAGLPLAWSAAIAGRAGPAPDFTLPAVPGWTPAADRSVRPWAPHFAGADRLRIGHYRNPSGQQVDLAIVVYARQSEGRELVGFGQGAVGPDSAWAWSASGPPPSSGRLDRIASFGTGREVATFYRVGEVLTGSALEVKLETMKRRLLGGPQQAAAVLVSAEAPAPGVSPRPAMDAFLVAAGGAAALAEQAAGLPRAR